MIGIDTRKVAQEYRLTRWAEIIQTRKTRGQSIREFCEAEGFSKNTFYYWQRRIREELCEQLAERQAQESALVPSFTEVVVVEAPAEAAVPEEAGRIHAEVGGITISADSAFPMEKLAALLRELGKS